MKSNVITPIRKRTCDVAKKRHFFTKVSYKNFSVLVWTKWYWLRLCTFQTAVFCLNVLQWQHFTKNKRLLKTESLLIQTIFTDNRHQENLLMWVIWAALCRCWEASDFLRICKMVLQNNRWFCGFVCLARDINWNIIETTANAAFKSSALWKMTIRHKNAWEMQSVFEITVKLFQF